MTPESNTSHAKQQAENRLTVPTPDLPPASHAEKCASLLAFCRRAVELEKFLPTTSQVSNYFSSYVEIVRVMESPALSSWTPEKVVQSLKGVLITRLSSHYKPEELSYWIAVSNALVASISLTMNGLSRDVAEASSNALRHGAESSVPYLRRLS